MTTLLKPTLPGLVEEPARAGVLAVQPDRLAEWLAAQGAPAYRARQIRGWIYQRRAVSFADMTDLPKPLRSGLGQSFTVLTSRVEAHQVATDKTEKLLLRWPDGEQVECVLMRERKRRTVCLSTQSGCAMGCVFCASGLAGLRRNLSAHEIVEQALVLRNLLPEEEHLTHVVVMGMGEPLANARNLEVALDCLTSPAGLNLSARHVTVSTVGIPGGIRKLAAFRQPYQLAVSLHAPNNELRSQLVPAGRLLGFDELLGEALDYQRTSGRQVTFEYVLLEAVNDRPEHARQLATRLRGQQAHVNLIPYNQVASLSYAGPSPVQVNQFAEILRQARVNVTIRKRKGARIAAACGQLRLSTQLGVSSPDSSKPTSRKGVE